MLGPDDGSKQVMIDDARGGSQAIRRRVREGSAAAQSSEVIVVVLRAFVPQDTARHRALLVADELRPWLHALQPARGRTITCSQLRRRLSFVENEILNAPRRAFVFGATKVDRILADQAGIKVEGRAATFRDNNISATKMLIRVIARESHRNT